jgi:predicted DNA binding CopG/RHH family protein
MGNQNNDLYDIKYFDEDEKDEIHEIETNWKPGNKFPSNEEERIMTKLKDSVINSKQKKDSKITFRLPKDDLIGLKAKARHAGIDYQPLLAAIIHKYVMNEIKIEL